MNKARYLDIALPQAVRKNYTYQIPASLQGESLLGKRVWVSFGRRMAAGLVVKVHNQKPEFAIKMVDSILDEFPLFEESTLNLLDWLHKYYFSSLGEAIQAALPSALTIRAVQEYEVLSQSSGELKDWQKTLFNEILDLQPISLEELEKRHSEKLENKLNGLIRKKLIRVCYRPEQTMKGQRPQAWEWTENGRAKVSDLMSTKSGTKLPKWKKAALILHDRDLLPETTVMLTELYDELSDYTLNRLREDGILHRVDFNPKLLNKLSPPVALNEEQQQAYLAIEEKLLAQSFQTFLLHGITGSGKTEVYIHALKRCLEQGKGGLILVPEIALTPQTVRRFQLVFGNRIAVLHSRLSHGERLAAWEDLRSGDKDIAIGARSAIFAPVQNLGLIIVDEEHDSSYQQNDPAPRYNARDVAIMRAHLLNAVCVLGSATPALNSWQNAQTNKYILLTLTHRHSDAKLPPVKTLDLRQYRKAMRGPLSVELYERCAETLERGEQIILLHNRRGFSTYLNCESCGNVQECPHCSVSLTYHKAKNELRCHYCGYVCSGNSACGVCGHPDLEKQGLGTQQVEEQVAEMLPQARILRMDQDTTSGKDAHARILNAFAAGEADILLGTQLVSKGLDFPNVTLVGVINTDTELAFPSYRANERLFVLLSQVAGRAGRGTKAGTVVFQTYNPDSIAIKCAETHDYRAFAAHELAIRKEFGYPPFQRLIRFEIKAVSEDLASQVATFIGEQLGRRLSSQDILGPAPSVVYKQKNWHVWDILTKVPIKSGSKSIEPFLEEVMRAVDQKTRRNRKKVRINIAVDPLN